MPSLTVQGKSSTTITLLLNGSYNDYSFAKNGLDIGLEIIQQTADINSFDPNATTVTFKNLIPNTTYQFGIIDDNDRKGEVMAGTTIPVKTDASTEITDVPTEEPTEGPLVAPPSTGGSGLSDGAIIGIILGSIIGLWLIYYYSYVKYFKLA